MAAVSMTLIPVSNATPKMGYAKDGIQGAVSNFLEAYFSCTEAKLADFHPGIAEAPRLHCGDPILGVPQDLCCPNS
jgi:hypothetical protein